MRSRRLNRSADGPAVRRAHAAPFRSTAPSVGSGPPMEATRRQSDRSRGAAPALVTVRVALAWRPSATVSAGRRGAHRRHPGLADRGRHTRRSTAGPVGYVVCPDAVTPVELRSHARRGAHPVCRSPGRRPSATTRSRSPPTDGGPSWSRSRPRRADRPRNVLIPIDLATRAGRTADRAARHGRPRAVVVMHDGRTVLAASGTTVVPVDVASRAVGRPLDLGAGQDGVGHGPQPDDGHRSTCWSRTASSPSTRRRPRRVPPIPTGLTVSSVSSPHGLVVSPDGATLCVAGQGASGLRWPGGARLHRHRAWSARPRASTASASPTPSALAITPDGSPAAGGRLGQQLDRHGADRRPDPTAPPRPTCPPAGRFGVHGHRTTPAMW